MPRSLRVPCAAAVAVAILAAGALFAGPPASACTTEVEGGCAGWSPVPPLPAEGEYELIGDLPASGGVALALWSGGPSGAIALEAERRGCAVSAVYANDPGGGLTLVPHYWSWSMPSLPASSPVLVECAPRLVGRVLDADGQPLGGVYVQAHDWAHDEVNWVGHTETRQQTAGLPCRSQARSPSKFPYTTTMFTASVARSAGTDRAASRPNGRRRLR